MSDYVTLQIGSQEFGVAVKQVRDVLRRQYLTPVPLAPPAIAGLLNLRGHIVTAIDLRARRRAFRARCTVAGGSVRGLTN